MDLKIYTSFDEINNELEILKLEKELNYHKLTLSFDKAKENIQPHSIKKELVLYVKERLSDSFKSILIVVIPYVMKFLKRKKEAN